ncbi:MAG: FHA domain-containing protein [Lentisphaerae bacterium]|nr:FHA domain-containing protein [Lentisphaerota bacterium]
MACLVGMSGPVKGQTFVINKERLTLGRHPANDIVLADETVSAQHCYLSRRGDRYILRDLNSTNGTLLNAKRITAEEELKPKNVIQIGSAEFVFNAGSEESSAAATAAVTQVVVDGDRPVVSPAFFESISPLGSRRKSRPNLGLLIFVVIGVAALASLILFLIRIIY